MEDLSRSDAPTVPPENELREHTKPGPCREYLVWSLLLALVGGLTVWLGIAIREEGWASGGLGHFLVLMVGVPVLCAGLAVLLVGISRAAAGIDYLVRQSR